MNEKPLLAYFGHHKCATVWIHRILEDICKELSLNTVYIHSAKQFNQDLETFVKENHIDFLTYANADLRFVSRLTNFKGFHVVRDPRDLGVSSYFSHLHSHATDEWDALKKHRETLQQAKKPEGLLLDMEFIRWGVFKRLEKWDYSLPHIMEIKMEDLTRDSLKIFAKIFEFLGILDNGAPGPGNSFKKISLDRLKEILYKNRFSAMAGGRKPGEENVKHHFRKGIAGDWLNHFNEPIKKYFKENYSDLLIKLGYEKDANW